MRSKLQHKHTHQGLAQLAVQHHDPQSRSSLAAPSGVRCPSLTITTSVVRTKKRPNKTNISQIEHRVRSSIELTSVGAVCRTMLHGFSSIYPHHPEHNNVCTLRQDTYQVRQLVVRDHSIGGFGSLQSPIHLTQPPRPRLFVPSGTDQTQELLLCNAHLARTKVQGSEGAIQACRTTIDHRTIEHRAIEHRTHKPTYREPAQGG